MKSLLTIRRFLFAPTAPHSPTRNAKSETGKRVAGNVRPETRNLNRGMGRGEPGTPRERRSAFSLIEVNVAILVIAGGMLSLFTLFPAGLRLSTAAMSDTRQVLFADEFFAFFEDGLLADEDMRDISNWQDVDKFWAAGCDGLKEGFDKINVSNNDWPDNDLFDSIKDAWDPDLDKKRFKMKKDAATGGGTQGNITLRFRSGIVRDYFSESDAAGKLPAEFVVRIASDFPEKYTDDKGVNHTTHKAGSKYKDINGVQRVTHGDDNLVWRVSLIVSDEGENGWFYDNSVYHRDFRYAELP